MAPHKLLIVDDNEELLLGLKMFLKPHFKEIQTLKNPNQLNSLLDKELFDVILLDMNFSAGVNTGNEGLFWMRKILEKDPDAIIILITAYGDIELAVKAMKEGASDFIQKSWDEAKILSTILAASKLSESKKEISSLKLKQKHLKDRIDKKYQMCVGISDKMKEVLATIEKVAKTDANILILGENGTGKEVIAREIHRLSNRNNEVFVAVDLGSLPESLFESEMFGYTKGAFTDAKENKPGRLEIANGGSLFLDEIGNLPLNQQSKLLSVLQNREITPLGSVRKIPLDIRLICATNKSLQQMILEKLFREDLLYRINTIQIELPPLRERREDIPILAEYFLLSLGEKYCKRGLRLSDQAIDKLRQHSWPGNIRELQHALEKAVILSDSNQLKPDDFNFQEQANHVLPNPLTLNIEDHEKSLISKAIEKFKGNMSQAARELGINRSTLYEKIKKYGIQ